MQAQYPPKLARWRRSMSPETPKSPPPRREETAGRSVPEILRREGPMAPDRAVQVMAKALAAVGELHTTSKVHCALRSDRVVVSVEGHVKVLDLEAAKGESELGPSKMSPASMDVASARYMSPEQAMGLELDARKIGRAHV